MNYLAHAYLSFEHPSILVGNMVSDFIKGKKKFDYAEDIQEGIRLHRSIDMFTDAHEATAEAKKVFKPAVGLYAGAFVDVAYDHFLAKDENEFGDDQLNFFAERTYATLQKHKEVLPERFAAMLPYMQSQNWLGNYGNMQGIKNSFGGLVRRAKYLQTSHEAWAAFQQHYQVLQACYNIFFPAVKLFALKQVEDYKNESNKLK